MSNEFKSTLQSEIGLDDIKRDLQTPTPKRAPPPPPVSRDVPAELFVADPADAAASVTQDMKVRATRGA